MADNSATIIAASLDSDALEKSINKLVETVATKTKDMADNFTKEVGRMEQAIKNLGNVKVDFGGTADGGSSRRTSKQKEEESQVKATTQAYKEQAATFDQQAASVKRASRGSALGLKKELDETSNSYSNLIQQLQRTIAHFDVSPIQSLRMRQHELEAGMRTASNEAAKAKKDVDELNTSIANYRQTLETLPKNGQGFSNRQAIQKEINDLITLRDVASAEQQKWESAGRQLASQYEVVKNEIRQIGQALVAAEESEKHVTTELDKQLQKINEISSRKTATQTYRDAISMETNSLEKAESKLAVLKSLKEKILNTDLLSKKDTESLTSYITYTASLVERMRNKTAKSTKDDEDATKKAAEAEKRWAENIVARGRVAQETSRKLIQMLNEEAQAGGKGLMGMFKIDGKDVNAVRELEKAIKDMQMQYNQMSDMDKDSAIGRALKRDIENAKIASGVISGYNKAASGVFNRTSDSESFKIRNYETLKNVLKELTNQYNQVSIAEIKAGNANHIIDAIQRTSREAQKLQSIMNRPTSFASAMKLSEKTLDDLSYKIRQLQNYKLGIDLQNPNAANEIKQVDDAILKLQKDMDKYIGKSKDILNSNNALGRSWNYMKNRLAFYFSVGASTQFIKNLIEVRSQYEMNERALGILIGSAERGTQIFNELSQMALVSPYTLIELSAAAKQLTAYDVAARDVVDTTRRLADMAAAVGIPIERLTYALGQIKAYGYLNSRDARMFANAGIPLVKQLSEYYTELEGRLVSTADVYDRIKKKSIDYNGVMEVMYKMTDQGGKFFDFQAKMADTLKVRLANLTLAWNNMLNDMGKDTQGVLTWGIGALRDMFNQWRVLDRAIKDVAWVVGIRTGIALASYSLQKFIALLRGTQSQMALSEVFGKRLANVIRTLGRAMLSLAKNPLTWVGVVAIGLYQMEQAIWGANEAQIALNESIRDGAKDNYDNITKFLDQYKQVRESLYTTQKVAIGNMYDPATGKASATAYVEQSVKQDINKNEAKKAWEAIREQIELTTRSSDQYIGRLLEISNMSERVRQGFNILDDIRVVNAALKELDEDTIKVEKELSGWWNVYMLPDGLVGNLKDYTKQLRYIEENWGSLEKASERGSNASEAAVSDLDRELKQLRDDIKVTTDSIINFIELKGWSGDTNKINEVFKQITDKLILDNQLDPQKAFVLQTQVEEARSQAAKQALLQRINDEKAALAQASDENQRKALTDSINANVAEYNNWNDFNGRKKVEWERFTKWLKEQHISETTAMFRNMDAEAIKSLNFQEGKHAEWVTRMVTQYAKEHKMSYDEAFNYLKSWVRSANQWSIFIPLTISTEDKKSVYDQLGEYDKAIDEADAQIERLTKRIDELRKKKKLDKDETDELIRAEQELSDAQKAKADAESKGGHGKKEKKDEKAAQKAAKQAESELAKALKDELKLIETVRSAYKDLTKEGENHADAVEKSVSGYEKSVANINKVLEKYGVKLDLTKFAGISNPHELQEMFKQQLNALAGKAKPTEIQAIEVELQKVNLDVEKYDLTKITKGLNNELDRLKDEYELAVSLDADPELGGMFADWMGIDMNELPRTAQEYAKEYTDILNKYLKNKKSDIELPNLLEITNDDLRAFQEQADAEIISKEWVDNINKGVKAVRDVFKKETSDQIKDWDKLLEKYAEYETKINKIQNDAVKERVTFAQQFGTEDEKATALNLQTQILATTDPQEKQKLIQQLQKLILSIAGDDKAKINLAVSIDNKNSKDLAKASFEEFQKSPEWIIATGDLSGMTDKAIGGLIKRLEEYKKKSKNLDPKQIKRLNDALRKLYKQQREGNPFASIANMLDQAKQRTEDIQPELDSIMSDIIALEKEIGDNDPTEEQAKHLEELKERWKELYEQGNVSANEWVNTISQTVNVVKGAVGVFDDLAKAIGGVDRSDVDKVFSIIDKAVSGAQTGASFGTYGAIIGAVVGAAAGIISEFADEWSGNAGITASVQSSERAVKRLEMSFVDLEQAIDSAYGTAVIGARQAALANKELQLAEIQRQIQLEKSRKAKNRDRDKILDLQKQYRELYYEIQNGYKEIVDDLMGTDVASFAENLVSSMISAFKQGEDYMKVFSDKFDEMIDNMIMKSIVSRVVSQYMDALWDDLDARINDRTKNEADALANAKNRNLEIMQMSDEELAWRMAWERSYEKYGYGNKDFAEFEFRRIINRQEEIDAYRKAAEEEEEAAQRRLDAASAFTDSDIDYVMEEITNIMPELGEKLKDILGEYYSFGESSEQQLSALQQGIQGITEDTAGALEAYMNGVSQQVYYQSEILTQIRDAVVVMDGDVQLGTQAQMLLQLQQSYAVQMAIQTILEGWSSPNGLAVRVEMQ